MTDEEDEQSTQDTDFESENSEEEELGFIDLLLGRDEDSSEELEDEELEEVEETDEKYEKEQSIIEQISSAIGLNTEEFDPESHIEDRTISKESFVPPTDESILNTSYNELLEEGPFRPQRKSEPYSDDELYTDLGEVHKQKQLVTVIDKLLTKNYYDLLSVVDKNVLGEGRGDVDAISEYGLTTEAIEDYMEFEYGQFVLGADPIFINLQRSLGLSEIQTEFLKRVHRNSAKSVGMNKHLLTSTPIFLGRPVEESESSDEKYEGAKENEFSNTISEEPIEDETEENENENLDENNEDNETEEKLEEENTENEEVESLGGEYELSGDSETENTEEINENSETDDVEYEESGESSDDDEFSIFSNEDED